MRAFGFCFSRWRSRADLIDAALGWGSGFVGPATETVCIIRTELYRVFFYFARRTTPIGRRLGQWPREVRASSISVDAVFQASTMSRRRRTTATTATTTTTTRSQLAPISDAGRRRQVAGRTLLPLRPKKNGTIKRKTWKSIIERRRELKKNE